MIKPAGKRIIFEMLNEEATTESGIIIDTSTTSQDTIAGKVLGIGEEVKEIKENDKIYVEKHAVFEIMMGGKSYNIVQEASVIAYEREE
jgi:chaperonin GroES